MTLPTCELSRHATISPHAEGDVLISASIGPRGEMVALWSAPADEAALRSHTEHPGWASFPDPKSPRPVAVRITAHAPERNLVTRINDLKLAHTFVQPLPGGRILLAGARSQWRPEGADRNAIIYDSHGHALAEEILGDGIEHVLATAAGDIWVGYFDEGIFGNFGWGRPEGPDPVGACGLIRFSPDLRPAWCFPGERNPPPVSSISDCYALNVADDEVWTCCYEDFSIVRICDGRLTVWRNAVRGARALAAAGTRAALFGGYAAERDRLTIGNLDGDCFIVTQKCRLTLPGGLEIPPGTSVFGRSDELHFLTRDTWHKVSVHDLAGGLTPP